MKTSRVKPSGRLISVSSSCVLLFMGLSACSSRQANDGGSAQTGAPASSNSASTATVSQPRPGANAKTYRGSLNDRGLEMRLAWDGERVSGSYAYDGIAQEIGLEGRSTGKEKFDLSERDAAGKTTGKWSCDGERQGEWDQDFSCKWTKADGSGELFVALFEQAASPSGWRVAPKTVENRKAGVRASYPQLVAPGGAQLSTAAAHFNQLLEKKVGDEARAFADGLEGEKNTYFHADYNVLLATEDLVSVEIVYDSYAGGAHPSSGYDAVTYDLRADRELELEDIFKPDSGYEKAVAAHCDRDIRRRAGVLEAEAAKEEGRKAEPQDESPVLPELLEEISAFALTPRGLMIYYDLPHVVAAFDRNFVPYSEVKNFLKPDSPAAQLAR
ncbi:MAG: PdaC/SigV domain-containing protein [Pyrinomonadaceae bacterium]